MQNTWEARMKRLSIVTWLATAVAAFVLFAAPASASNLSIGGSSDCDDNAVVRCGVHSSNALAKAYNNSAYVRAVYGSFGINRADINNLDNTAVMGTVTKQGDVFVNGRLVARNAMTAGRQDMAGSTRVNSNGAIFFRRPPSVSFASSSLPAYVVMNNGQFQFAVIASCGNAVSAVPVRQKAAVAPARAVSRPQKPAPAPTQTQSQAQAQTQTQSQSQSQEVTVQTPPAPAPAAPAPAPAPPAETSQVVTSAAPAAAVLPNTGPGTVAGLFALSSVFGYFGFRRFLLGKLSR